MALPQALTPAATITAAENYMLVLSTIIFTNRNLADVEEQVWKASKIAIALDAITFETPADIAYNRIIIGLNELVFPYNQTLLT